MIKVKIMLMCLVALFSFSLSYADTLKQEGFEYNISEVESWINPVDFDDSSESKNDASASWLLTDTQLVMKKKSGCPIQSLCSNCKF